MAEAAEEKPVERFVEDGIEITIGLTHEQWMAEQMAEAAQKYQQQRPTWDALKAEQKVKALTKKSKKTA